MKKASWLALSAALLAGSAPGGVLSLRPGDLEIVVDESQKPMAVSELQTLLGEAFGAAIPVVASPSGTNKTISIEFDASFAYDDVRLVTTTGGVRIVNGASRMHGVYEFLERYAGMRFYFPGPLGTIVPRRTSLEVPLGAVDVKPAYTQRSCDMNWGLNGPWYSLKGGGPADKAEARRLRNIAAARMRLAPRLMCCHGLVTEFRLLDRFGESHPEYFALMKAKDGTLFRDAAKSLWDGHRGQLCHTSGVWDEIFRMSVARLRSGEPYVDVMPQDGMQRCWCGRYQAAYSRVPNDPNWATDLIWGRTIELANRLSAAGVGGAVTQMAYSPYRRIPDLDFPSNVLVMVAANGAWSLSNPDRLNRENGNIRAWAKKVGHKVWIWNYTGKFGRRQRNVNIPQMTPRAIGTYYASLSDAIFGSYMESRTDRWIYNYLNYYVYNKVSWDVNADVDALLDEHDRLMFGPAAPEMKAYYARLEELWMNRIACNVVSTNLGPEIREPTERQKWLEIYSPAVIAEFEGYFRTAARKLRKGSLEARRLSFIHEHFQKPLAAAAEAYLEKIDAARNEAKRAARKNTSVLKGPRFDSAEAFALDGAAGKKDRSYAQNVAGLIKPNTKYRVSYFVKMENVVPTRHNGGVNACLFDGKMGPLFPKPFERIGTHGWIYQEFEQTTSSDIGSNARLRIGLDGATGKAWIRGVRLEEVSGACEPTGGTSHE